MTLQCLDSHCVFDQNCETAVCAGGFGRHGAHLMPLDAVHNAGGYRVHVRDGGLRTCAGVEGNDHRGAD